MILSIFQRERENGCMWKGGTTRAEEGCSPHRSMVFSGWGKKRASFSTTGRRELGPKGKERGLTRKREGQDNGGEERRSLLKLQGGKRQKI